MEFVWMVEQWKGDGVPPEFQGIFTSCSKAISVCKLDTFAVTRVRLDEEIPVETCSRPHCWYPLREAEPMEE